MTALRFSIWTRIISSPLQSQHRSLRVSCSNWDCIVDGAYSPARKATAQVTKDNNILYLQVSPTPIQAYEVENGASIASRAIISDSVNTSKHLQPRPMMMSPDDDDDDDVIGFHRAASPSSVDLNAIATDSLADRETTQELSLRGNLHDAAVCYSSRVTPCVGQTSRPSSVISGTSQLPEPSDSPPAHSVTPPLDMNTMVPGTSTLPSGSTLSLCQHSLPVSLVSTLRGSACKGAQRLDPYLLCAFRLHRILGGYGREDAKWDGEAS
jgi:hypothetical protein